MKAISLFSGAGGLDLGCEAAGFETVAAVEWNERARETMLANAQRFFPELSSDSVFSDITAVSGDRLLDHGGLKVGGLTFSTAAHPARRSLRADIGLSTNGWEPTRRLPSRTSWSVLGSVQPKMFLMENVYGLAYRNQNRQIFDQIPQER